MSASLAVVPGFHVSQRPDISWIKKNVPVMEVAKTLGMRIRRGRARCWRPENHRNSDADPSVRFHERRNRVRCFVCDMRGGHSCVDLVIGVLSMDVGSAVRWIAERFTVPNIKPGRPVGHRAAEPAPYRVGTHGSDFEVLVKSGMWGQLSPAERSILQPLREFRDPDSGLTQLSYAAIMRYSGVGSSASVSQALKQLARRHAIEIHQGVRFGLTRRCSAYRVTLDDPKFYELCNEVCKNNREEVAAERAYRKGLRSERERKSLRPPNLNMATGGGLRPPDPPLSLSLPRQTKAKEKPSTCKGLNLSSQGEVASDKPLQAVKREIGVSPVSNEPETLRRWQMLQRQAEEIKAKYGVKRT